jgi:hypothetical protein
VAPDPDGLIWSAPVVAERGRTRRRSRRGTTPRLPARHRGVVGVSETAELGVQPLSRNPYGGRQFAGTPAPIQALLLVGSGDGRTRRPRGLVVVPRNRPVGSASTSLVIGACHLVGGTGARNAVACTDRSEFVVLVGGP